MTQQEHFKLTERTITEVVSQLHSEMWWSRTHFRGMRRQFALQHYPSQSLPAGERQAAAKNKDAIIAEATAAYAAEGDPVDALLEAVRTRLAKWPDPSGKGQDASYAKAQWECLEETTNARVEAACVDDPTGLGAALRQCGVQEVVGSTTLQTPHYADYKALSARFGNPDALGLDDSGQLVSLEFKLGSSYSALQHLRYLHLHATAAQMTRGDSMGDGAATPPSSGVHLVVRPAWSHQPTSTASLSSTDGWWHRAASPRWLTHATPVDTQVERAVDHAVRRFKKHLQADRRVWLQRWIPTLVARPPKVYEVTWWALRDAFATQSKSRRAVDLFDRALPVLERRSP